MLSGTETRTGEGGSAFTPVRVNTPLDVVPAFATVFFRPFVFESNNAQGLLTAGEGMLLLGLLILARRRLRALPRLMRTTPYVGFAAGYVLAFVYAFSSFGNFGILARQRVQAIPFLLVFLALPAAQSAGRHRKAAPATPASRRHSVTRVPVPRAVGTLSRTQR